MRQQIAANVAARAKETTGEESKDTATDMKEKIVSNVSARAREVDDVAQVKQQIVTNVVERAGQAAEYAAVKQAEKQCEAAMASDDGKSKLRELFHTLDKNSDGEVTAKEWGQGAFKNKELIAQYFGGSSNKEICGAFKRLDVSRTDKLTWEQFEAGTKPVDTAAAEEQRQALKESMAKTEGKEDLKQLFMSLDADGNGHVTADEWAAGVCAEGNREIAAKYFARTADWNMHKVNVDEHMKLFKAIREAFESIDSNSCGKMTWAEFEAASTA